MAKRLKLKVRKILGIILTFAEVTEERLVGLSLSWIGLNLPLLYNEINLIHFFTLSPEYFNSGKYSLIYIMSFFINQPVQRTIIAFPFNIYFIASSLCYFFNSKIFLNCFLQFFFGKTTHLFKKLSQDFHLTYSLSFLLFITFSTLNFFWLVFCNSFFVKRANNFFTFKITKNTCPQHNDFNFLNQRNFFRPISNIAFCKSVFIFWYSYLIANFEFRTFLIILLIKVTHV